MTREVYLIRHCEAEARSSWSEPDDARPLSATGRAQALALADLDARASTPMYSSPAVRCISTIEPLAERAGVKVQIEQRLAEGSDPRDVVEWISSARTDLVLCGHGDVFPEVMRLLVMRDMTTDGPNACQKGSVWTCTFEDDVPLHGTYRPPPNVG